MIDPTVPYEQAQELDEARALETQSIAAEWLEGIEEDE